MNYDSQNETQIKGGRSSSDQKNLINLHLLQNWQTRAVVTLRQYGSEDWHFVPEESSVTADNIKAALTHRSGSRMEWTGKVQLSSQDTELRLKGKVDYTTNKGEKMTGSFNFVAHLKGTTELEKLCAKN